MTDTNRKRKPVILKCKRDANLVYKIETKEMDRIYKQVLYRQQKAKIKTPKTAVNTEQYL